MFWIIKTEIDGETLFWSNVWGWTVDDYETFSDAEKCDFNLPIGGEWEAVDWRKIDD